jgi:nitrous oxidase accessory protein NosD
MRYSHPKVLLVALFLCLVPTAMASTMWYVDGNNGSDSNNCLSALTACQTIGHAISLAASGDSIKIAAATYIENLVIDISLKLLGAPAPPQRLSTALRPETATAS